MRTLRLILIAACLATPAVVFAQAPQDDVDWLLATGHPYGACAASAINANDEVAWTAQLTFDDEGRPASLATDRLGDGTIDVVDRYVWAEGRLEGIARDYDGDGATDRVLHIEYDADGHITTITSTATSDAPSGVVRFVRRDGHLVSVQAQGVGPLTIRHDGGLFVDDAEGLEHTRYERDDAGRIASAVTTLDLEGEPPRYETYDYTCQDAE